MPPARFLASPTRWVAALAIGLVAAAFNLGVWWLFQGRVSAPDHSGMVAGLSYSGADRWQNPLAGQRPSPESLARDLDLLARHTDRIRTYSAADHPTLPEQAREHGLELMLGAFLSHDLDSNQRELQAAIGLARSHPNIRRLIVGNETQLTAQLPPNRLANYLDRARSALASTTVQVSTAEPWHVWLDQPQLAQHVDFIAIHVLPYWEGEPIGSAVQASLDRIAQVQARFPGRDVVVAEIGWPSNGQPIGRARATPANQARFVRDFLQQADARGIDYFLIEAFDQPWKIATEGRAGAYWGLWDSWREPKFALSGPIASNPFWTHQAVAACGLGLALALPFLLAARRLGPSPRMALGLAAQGIASLAIVLLSVPLSHYLTGLDLLGLALVLAALGFICATLLAQAFEFVDRFWTGRALPAPTPTPPAEAPAPFISIHLACANEPPEMVIAAVESLLAIDWPAFEVIVVDNNTTDPQARQQLAQWMNSHPDPRLRFVQYGHLPGFKAGALNQALALTRPEAQWVAVIDADYLVDPRWFKAVQAHLQDPSVGVVQAPQAHRQWHQRPLDRMMNWETEGFFRIGMHHRHERNAIVQHGTMTLVRASALQRLRWREDGVCEDTELGLRLLCDGHRAVYVDQVLGTGLLPADLVAYARQRRRWALGAMQIFRQHARSLLGRSPLTLGQRYHFLAGWLPWLGDALHLLFSLVMIVFSLGMIYLPDRVDPPLWLFVAPLMAFFAVRLLAVPLLYARCVPCGLTDRLGAAVAGMALSHRIAKGVWQGLRGHHAVFDITRKAAATGSTSHAPAAPPYAGPPVARGIEEELGLLAGLVFCMLLLWFTRGPGDAGRLGWIAILFIQSLPYWATLVCRMLEQTGSGTSAQSSPSSQTNPVNRPS
ncbi:MAG TPA: glycosyltransferase [Hydrogenophaga sp.]|uniref:glycosyltransferase n=1 Tax=Hydrogenophaga sp. TaxID=1904254 RepID=UPI002BF6BDB6|nr:glycosyltransferase [Hydrogenophaga sp.]HMN94598.1 glycosyltransferase [Hydrogenophaga sp.]